MGVADTVDVEVTVRDTVAVGVDEKDGVAEMVAVGVTVALTVCV